MMNLKEMIGFVRALRGHMSETVRSSVAYGVCGMVERGLTDGDARAWWNQKGRMNFLSDCNVMQDPCTTPDDIAAPPTALAEFINRWRATCMYKGVDGEWKELSQDMKALITTMTEDLEEVARVQQ